MKYGVIVCPKCRKAKGFELKNKTTRCTYCNKTIVIDNLKIFYKTDSQEKLTNAIGLVNANIDGKYEDFKTLLKSLK